MRLWTLHPRYLDTQGLVALWREGLLARKVLRGETRGYTHHPQLDRFRAQPSPSDSIASFLAAVHAESVLRGYSFDPGKLDPHMPVEPIVTTRGQLQQEWHHLMRKLAIRNPALHERWQSVEVPECHPLFRPGPGPIEPWERG